MIDEQAVHREKEPSPLLTRRRRVRFTPERFRQIENLLERGKSRDGIADILGVTVGSLQVTCSKKGISLRRPKSGTGVNLLRTSPHPTNDDGRVTLRPGEKQCYGSSQLEPFQPPLIAKPQQERSNALEACSATVAIRLQYRGKEQTTELRLMPQTILQLALEAAFRDMTIGEFIGELITAIVNKDPFAPLLDNIDPARDRIRGERS